MLPQFTSQGLDQPRRVGDRLRGIKAYHQIGAQPVSQPARFRLAQPKPRHMSGRMADFVDDARFDSVEHASMTTTAIYLDALGEEEREIAARMWAAPVTPVPSSALQPEASARKHLVGPSART